jgi:multisubunit Na+/H+ antiporter MnhF subunit
MQSDSRLVIAKVLAGAALAMVIVYVIAGPQTMLPASVVGISTLVISVVAFVLSLRKRSYLVPVMLSANGIIHTVSAAIALGHLGVSASSGPLIAFIFGLLTIGLGVAKGIGTVRIGSKTATMKGSTL